MDSRSQWAEGQIRRYAESDSRGISAVVPTLPGSLWPQIWRNNTQRCCSKQHQPWDSRSGSTSGAGTVGGTIRALKVNAKMERSRRSR